MYNKQWIALAACAVLTLAGCGEEPDTGAGKDVMVVQVYTVPPQQAAAVGNALRDVLAGNSEQPGVGRVSTGADGRLLVMAPPATQKSIAEAIRSLSDTGAAKVAMDDAPVRLRFWFLRSAAASSAASDARLEALKPVLDEVGSTMGQDAFELVDFVEILALPGQGMASTQTSCMTQVSARLTPGDRGLLLEAELSTPSSAQIEGKTNMTSPPNVHTRTRLKADEFVVLNMSSDDAAGDGLRLVVVQAQPQGGKD